MLSLRLCVIRRLLKEHSQGHMTHFRLSMAPNHTSATAEMRVTQFHIHL